MKSNMNKISKIPIRRKESKVQKKNTLRQDSKKKKNLIILNENEMAEKLKRNQVELKDALDFLNHMIQTNTLKNKEQTLQKMDHELGIYFKNTMLLRESTPQKYTQKECKSKKKDKSLASLKFHRSSKSQNQKKKE